jgi:mercuric ion binding protein
VAVDLRKEVKEKEKLKAPVTGTTGSRGALFVGGLAAILASKKEAVVTFDDAKTSAAALIKATTDAGYPSAVKETGKK